MIFAFVLLFMALASAQRFSRYPHFFPEDRSSPTWWWDDDRLTHVMQFTTAEQSFYGWHDAQPDVADKYKVVNVTSEMYWNEICRSDEVWLIVFLKKQRTHQHIRHSEQTFMALQVLADEYYGDVRIGVIDVIEEEFLKIQFDVYNAPSGFLIKNGTTYELLPQQIFYDNYRSFIEFNHKNETKRYNVFPTMTFPYVNAFTVYLFYAYRDGHKYWSNYGWMLETKLDEYGIDHKSYSLLEWYLRLPSTVQYHYTIGFGLCLLLVFLSILFLIGRCLCCRKV